MMRMFGSRNSITFYPSDSSNTMELVGKLWKPIVGLVIPIAFLPLATSENEATRCGYVLALMATFWMMEILPIAATALMPVALFPMLGIMSTNDATTAYMKATNMMFFGGLLMAIAVESSNLHKRIALKVLLIIGLSLQRIMLGIMLTTMFLSMWISNTASTAMMIPIVDAMISEIRTTRKQSVANIEPLQVKNLESVIADQSGPKVESSWTDNPKTVERVRTTLMLSIAYASNIGGTGTLTGTGTNLILQGLLDDMYPDSSEVTFATWFYYAAPGMLIAIAMAWCVLNILYLSGTAKTSKEQENRIKTLICKKYEELGTPSFQEMAVSLLFLVVVFLWLFRDPKFMPGWTSYLPSTIKVKDATPVILVALFMFLIPANFGQFTDGQTKKVATLLDWPTVQKRVPWGAILLLGGGLALAEGTKKSGLSHWLGTELMFLKSYSPFQALCILTTVVAFLTEVTSNVATASVVLPVVNQIALTMNANPLFLMVPTTVAVSFAFMLPVATPPNALVFESLDMRVIDMVKPGLVMNILCILLQILLVNTWGVFVFNFNQFPEWAQTQNTTISMH